MIGDTILTVYPRLADVVNSDHIVDPTYGPGVPLSANVQPHIRLTEAKAKLLGLSTTVSGVMLAIAADPSGLLKLGGKAAAGGISYDIASANPWDSHHVEAILVPMQGGQT
jgi:hypothetical protein